MKLRHWDNEESSSTFDCVFTSSAFISNNVPAFLDYFGIVFSVFSSSASIGGSQSSNSESNFP
ncbi:MAG: hypothetical protein KDD70_15905, partial [Bdellovibrionales bacterium]|nr:hypothetical protein [Bdellovibrionales bacterium]